MTFGARLAKAIEARGRLCVGIDPHPALLDSWGFTDSVFGLEMFAMTAVEAVAGAAAVVKPQSAFFERPGSKGVAVLEQVIAGCRERGALVLLDVKRGDIGSTVQAYADAYLDPTSPLAADAVTASPFLGIGSLGPPSPGAGAAGPAGACLRTGSLDPLADAPLPLDAGVFVLALTSNPEGPTVQPAGTADGRPVGAQIRDAVASRNADADGPG